jgi:hypothetical protein
MALVESCVPFGTENHALTALHRRKYFVASSRGSRGFRGDRFTISALTRHDQTEAIQIF